MRYALDMTYRNCQQIKSLSGILGPKYLKFTSTARSAGGDATKVHIDELICLHSMLHMRKHGNTCGLRR